jgi:hypothetical protein
MTAPARLPAPVRAPLGLKGKSSDSGGGTWGDRRIRYKMLDKAQRLLFDGGLPGDRQAAICRCHYRRIGSTVQLRVNTVSGRAHYHGLESCHNVWACPVCSNRITNGRRDDLQRALGYWKEQGGESYLVTATFPHRRSDCLVDLLKLMRKAADLFNTSRAARAARQAAGYVGQVRALEVTWGSWHGWHPHFHFLYFCQPGHAATLQALETAWVDALIKSGLADRKQLNDMLCGAGGASPAFNVQNGDYAAAYVAEFGHEPSWESKLEAGATWGLAAEMVKGASKTGRRLHGVTPFTLLAVSAELRQLPGLKTGRAVVLFCEYAMAFKGQRQLYWSPKLRAALQMGRLFTDAELPDNYGPKSADVTVYVFDHEEWALILAHRARDAAQRAAEESRTDGVRALLDRLRALSTPPIDVRISRELSDGTRSLGLDSPRFGGGA